MATDAETDLLAKAIFDWFNRSQDEDGRGAPPYTYNAEPEALTIGVDGYLDCRKLAAALGSAGWKEIGEVDLSTGEPKEAVQFAPLSAKPEKIRGTVLVPCEPCAGSGFTDKVKRGTWAMEPKEKICPVCEGRGWRKPADLKE